MRKMLTLFLVNKESTLLENAVAIHLRRRFGEELYYYKFAKTGIDIDFYLPGEGCAVQVTFNLEGVGDREIKSLVSFAEKTKGIKRLMIVTDEEEKTITINNMTIEVIPVYKLMMTENEQEID